MRDLPVAQSSVSIDTVGPECALKNALYTPTQAAPDELRLGSAQAYPKGDARTYFYKESVRVGSFSRMGEIDFSPGRLARLPPAAADKVLALPDAVTAGRFPARFSYSHQGQRRSVADYLASQRVMALMVVQGGQRCLEAYQYGRTPQHLFLGHSLAKSITSLAFGLALQEGLLPHLDMRADALVPALQGALHGQASLRQLLHMGSGARFEDRYDGLGDTARFSKRAAMQGIAAAAHLLQQREAPDGERFGYASAQTSILSLAFQAAAGQDLASYLAPRLWQGMGAQQEALWLQDRFGVVRGSGSFCATLADYARLGVLLANDGVRSDTGQRVLPAAYLQEATNWAQHPPAFQPGRATPHMGYGLHFWTLPNAPRRFALIGVYGQFVFVAPDLQLVMVQLSAGANAKNADTSLAQEAHALWQGLTEFFQSEIGV
jgi:CubicO group peptidase (beta-lactamase class C family)